MDADEILEVAQSVLRPEQFRSIEQYVLRRSWLGQTYDEMAKSSGYKHLYIKEVGSRLWQNLSEAIGENVTKKNLHLVFTHYQQNRDKKQHDQEPQKLARYVKPQNNSLDLELEAQLKFPSGPLPFGSPLYIYRPPVEEIAINEVRQPGCLLRIKAPSKMGKSSLLNQILGQVALMEYETVHLDLREAEATVFTYLDKFLRWLCINISKRLGLYPQLENYWDEEMGSKVSCRIYFEQYLLQQIRRPLVLALGEVNRVFDYPRTANDFLPMLRFWHELARQSQVWQKLRILLAHSTEIYVPLKLNQSPFNIGRVMTLPEFTLEQVQQLMHRCGLEWDNERAIQQARLLMSWVGGHPYLVSIALYYLSQTSATLAELLQDATTQTGIYHHYLRRYLALLKGDPELVAAMQQVLTAKQGVHLDALIAYKLESMGLIKLDGNLAQPSCKLYRLYFGEQLGV